MIAVGVWFIMGCALLELKNQSTEFPYCRLPSSASLFLVCNGMRIDSPSQINQKLVQDILALKVPTIVDVHVDRDETPQSLEG